LNLFFKLEFIRKFILVDPVTISIDLTVHYFNLEFDVTFLSQYVSFISIGIIVVTSIRGLLITLTKVRENEIIRIKYITFFFISFFILYQVVVQQM
jgi:hypothetical protein